MHDINTTQNCTESHEVILKNEKEIKYKKRK